MNTHSHPSKSAVKPGAILRAMGADPMAVTPESFVPPHLRNSSGNGSARPRVEIVRDGDRVMKILAHCPCGEIIEIECDYAENSTVSSTTSSQA